MPDEPIIDLQSDHFFMGEALRQAARAYAAEEVPVGAVVVRAGLIIARAFNQVKLLQGVKIGSDAFDSRGQFDFVQAGFPCSNRFKDRKIVARFTQFLLKDKAHFIVQIRASGENIVLDILFE